MILSLLFCSFLSKISTSPTYSVMKVFFFIGSSAITTNLFTQYYSILLTLEHHPVELIMVAYILPLLNAVLLHIHNDLLYTSPNHHSIPSCILLLINDVVHHTLLYSSLQNKSCDISIH